jgi:Tfp pilus assembly protein PilN
MRAVNLLPEGARRVVARGSGLSSYLLLGALAAVLLVVTVFTLSSKQVSDKEAELERTRTEATTAETRAGKLTQYTAFADLREKRLQTVTSLATSRFDWSQTLHEVARTIPAGASLSALKGTVQPGVSIDGESDPLRNALAVPAIELHGCVKSQKAVATMMASMRRIEGVQRVSLSSSEKADGGTSDGGCPAGYPGFSMTVFFNAPAAAPAAGAGSATGTTGTTGAAAAGTTTPAASGGAPTPTTTNGLKP